MTHEFLTSMSHELRTPLTVIIGQAEILRDEIHGVLNEAQQRSVTSIESSGRHLLALLNDLLDLARIEADKLELTIEPVNVELLCASCLMTVREEIHGRRLVVSMTLDPAVSSLRADPRRLRQILVQLLATAVAAAPEGGEIGIEVTGDRERRQVRFVVRDTGGGGGGTGLELARHLVRLHGGEFAVAGDAGRESGMTVTLPWEESR